MRWLALALLAWGCTIVPLPPDVVTGTVRALDGSPIEGATVELRLVFSVALSHQEITVLQLTRTGPDGRFRFAMGADRDVRFPTAQRDYIVIAAHADYLSKDSWPSEDVSQPIDLALDPWPQKGRVAPHADCLALCVPFAYLECRRVAEFHFGDKTRCDAWLRDPY